MPVNLSVKHVPDALAAALRRRAKQHHRSLQGELLAILHEAVEPGVRAAGRRVPVVREAAPVTWAPLSRGAVAPRSESAQIVRAMRDGRTRTVGELFDRLAAMGGGTPSESADIIRRSRSSR
jgi:plasmid stability protein